MLGYLRVRGLALLDDVTLTFEPGMNVLTGETGAGKSIIVGALSLLRGGRGSANLVRDGDQAAIVDAQFDPDANAAQALTQLLRDHGLPEDGADALVLQRVVSRTGRGRSFVQGGLTTQTVLGQVGEELLDICSQHEHHFLTHTPRHLEVLDAYAGNDAELADYVTRYRAFKEAEASLAQLQGKMADRASRIDYLSFQIEEIDRVAPEPGEHEALRKRMAMLRQARHWAEFAEQTHGELYERDEAITTRLATLAERAGAGGDDSEVLAQIHEQLVTAQMACEEAAQLAARLGGELELDPAELERGEDRLHELEGLRRKHGVEVDELSERAQAMRAELGELEHAGDHLGALRVRTEELENGCVSVAQRLHQRRLAAADGLARAVEAELGALHLGGATLHVRVEAVEELGPTGRDRAEFVFSANRGEPVAPLKRVASGGELSRVLLAIKTVLAGGDRVATYVFDEVDAGVGGAVAEAIGRRLKRAASEHQVLCVTHLPQIAAFADAHFRVEKRTRGGRTTTRVVPLNEDERVEELARMLGGKKVTDSARAHARQLIAAARPRKKRSAAKARRSL